jgi:hypothetical protein
LAAIAGYGGEFLIPVRADVEHERWLLSKPQVDAVVIIDGPDVGFARGRPVAWPRNASSISCVAATWSDGHRPNRCQKPVDARRIADARRCRASKVACKLRFGKPDCRASPNAARGGLPASRTHFDCGGRLPLVRSSTLTLPFRLQLQDHASAELHHPGEEQLHVTLSC